MAGVGRLRLRVAAGEALGNLRIDGPSLSALVAIIFKNTREKEKPQFGLQIKPLLVNVHGSLPRVNFQYQVI
jgi:hypothetical protein